MGWFIKVEYEPESEVVEETYLCRSLGDIEETVEWLKDESDGGAIMRVTKTRTMRSSQRLPQRLIHSRATSSGSLK